MRIEYKGDLSELTIMKDLFIERIDMSSPEITKLFKGITEKQSEQIRAIINKINNQNIEHIDFIALTYKHRGELLGFGSLCKAERVFIVASAAHINKTTIWLNTDITQLTDTTLRLFIKIFHTSPYVNIAYNSEISKAHLKRIEEEALC